MSSQNSMLSSKKEQSDTIKHPEFLGEIGVGRVDITPPPGIFTHNWGSLTRNMASGVHKPLFVSCLLFRSLETRLEQYLISADLSWWRGNEEEWEIRAEVLRCSQLKESQLLLHLSHSHSAPSTDLKNVGQAGGDLISAFREKVVAGIVKAIEQARLSCIKSCLSWEYGTCRLAKNRDQPVQTEAGLTTVVGMNPSKPADDTLLVGRVVDEQNVVRAVLVNYACHPVSLGGGNTKISPDYVGRMREVVEAEIGEGICVFLHGASGELTPRISYSSNPEDADKNGQELGYAVLETLSSMLPAQTRLAFDGIEQSGAPLGRWKLKEAPASSTLAIEMVNVELTYRDLPTLAEIDELLERHEEGYMRERLQRRRLIRQELGDGNSRVLRFPVWQMGNTVFVSLNAEAYSGFQMMLRHRFPGMAIVVMNIVNGYFSYLPSEEAYDFPDCYQVNVAIFNKGCLEKTVESTGAVIARLVDTGTT